MAQDDALMVALITPAYCCHKDTTFMDVGIVLHGDCAPTNVVAEMSPLFAPQPVEPCEVILRDVLAPAGAIRYSKRTHLATSPTVCRSHSLLPSAMLISVFLGQPCHPKYIFTKHCGRRKLSADLVCWEADFFSHTTKQSCCPWIRWYLVVIAR